MAKIKSETDTYSDYVWHSVLSYQFFDRVKRGKKPTPMNAQMEKNLFVHAGFSILLT